MRMRLLAAALLAFPACALAESMEAVWRDAASGLDRAGVAAVEMLETTAVEPDGAPVQAPQPPAQDEPILEWPDIEVLPGDMGVGPELGSFVLAERLDAHSDILPMRLGANDWDASLAADSTFDVQYLAFRREDKLVLHRLKDLHDLRRGVDVRIDEKTVYRFKVSINIFNPVRGSTLRVDPVSGTQGPNHKYKTGHVLDRTKAESYVFQAGGKEYWVLFGTDVDPQTDTLADTRTLLFINEKGTKSKAWSVPEGSLEAGAPVSVDLGGTKIVLVKTEEGLLRLHEWREDPASLARLP